jgi:hypothetical protein
MRRLILLIPIGFLARGPALASEEIPIVAGVSRIERHLEDWNRK